VQPRIIGGKGASFDVVSESISDRRQLEHEEVVDRWTAVGTSLRWGQCFDAVEALVGEADDAVRRQRGVVR
jgi:hypothetical protein